MRWVAKAGLLGAGTAISLEIPTTGLLSWAGTGKQRTKPPLRASSLPMRIVIAIARVAYEYRPSVLRSEILYPRVRIGGRPRQVFQARIPSPAENHLHFSSMLTIDTNEGISLLQGFLPLEILRCNIFALANLY